MKYTACIMAIFLVLKQDVALYFSVVANVGSHEDKALVRSVPFKTLIRKANYACCLEEHANVVILWLIR